MRRGKSEAREDSNFHTHRIPIWYIYLELVDFYDKCRYIYRSHGSYGIGFHSLEKVHQQLELFRWIIAMFNNYEKSPQRSDSLQHDLSFSLIIIIITKIITLIISSTIVKWNISLQHNFHSSKIITRITCPSGHQGHHPSPCWHLHYVGCLHGITFSHSTPTICEGSLFGQKKIKHSYIIYCTVFISYSKRCIMK